MANAVYSFKPKDGGRVYLRVLQSLSALDVVVDSENSNNLWLDGFSRFPIPAESVCGECFSHSHLRKLLEESSTPVGSSVCLTVLPGMDVESFCGHIGQIKNALGASLYLNGIITVVEGEKLVENLACDRELREWKPELSPFPLTKRLVSEVLVEHIETADGILLWWKSEIDDGALRGATEIIQLLNPRAALHICHSEKLVSSICFDLFPQLTVASPPGSSSSVENFRNLIPVDHSCNVRKPAAFVYRRRIPFHPERFLAFLEQWPEKVLRTRGTVWLAEARDEVFQLNQCGPTTLLFDRIGPWASLLSDRMPHESTRNAGSESSWAERWGDRGTELVFIGKKLPVDQLLRDLDGCLISELEMRQDWSRFNDPFSGVGE